MLSRRLGPHFLLQIADCEGMRIGSIASIENENLEATTNHAGVRSSAMMSGQLKSIHLLAPNRRLLSHELPGLMKIRNLESTQKQ
jgi:hypothetical protein